MSSPKTPPSSRPPGGRVGRGTLSKRGIKLRPRSPLSCLIRRPLAHLRRRRLGAPHVTTTQTPERQLRAPARPCSPFHAGKAMTRSGRPSFCQQTLVPDRTRSAAKSLPIGLVDFGQDFAILGPLLGKGVGTAGRRRRSAP